MKKLLSLALTLCMVISILPAALAAESVPASGTAYASEQSISIDGKTVCFQTYMLLDENGNGTNYVRLRDIACALSGTRAQFDVVYDGSIGILTGTAYTPVGGEMATPFSGDRGYAGGDVSLRINSAAVDMTAISLMDDRGNGYTYFKLRDLGQVLDFYVGWNGSAVVLDTARSYGEEPEDDRAAMAKAMLAVLDRELTGYCCARLADVNGNGVKELIVLREPDAMLYTWKDGQLTAESLGVMAGGQLSWSLCRNISTGEWGIEFQAGGAYYEDSTFFYPSGTTSFGHSFNYEDGDGHDTYRMNGTEVSRSEFLMAMGQNLRVEELVSDMDCNDIAFGEPALVTETRAELECLAAGKTTRDISDEALLIIARRVNSAFYSMHIGIMNNWPTSCNYDDSFTKEIDGNPWVFYRVPGFTSLEDVIRTTRELWNRKVSRSNPEFDSTLLPQISSCYITHNGALYRTDLGMGDGGIMVVVDKLLLRSENAAVFSGHCTYYGDEEILDNFTVTIVYEDGVWKYAE